MSFRLIIDWLSGEECDSLTHYEKLTLMELRIMATTLKDIQDTQVLVLAAIKALPAPLPAGTVAVAQKDLDDTLAAEQANLAALQTTPAA